MRYDVTALVGASRVETLAIDASDALEARTLVQDKGYAVLGVRRRFAALPLLRRRRAFPLQPFSQELRVMLDAGLTLPEALQALVEKESRDDLRRVLQRLASALAEGASFSLALLRQPDAFPPLYVATIRASEKTGDLPEALARYVTYQQQVDAVRRKIVAASIYPALLLAAGAMVALFLLGYVVPRFSAVYDDLGQQLPWFTGSMLAVGRVLHENAAAATVAFLGTAAALAYGVTRPSVQAAVLRSLWRIPRLGERLRVYDLARLYRTLAMLLRGGMPAVAAMRNASALLRPEAQARLGGAITDVEQGRALSQAMAERGLTTPVTLRMLRVGERSGRISELLERIAAYLEEDLARSVDWFVRLFEPALMLVIGAVIGAIVLLLYMPILELAGGLQ